MNRLRWLLPALVFGALLPVNASAQKYKDSKYTKDADKFIGLAMMRPDRDSRLEMYRQALAALEEGFVKEPDNAKIWFVAGQAHAGAGLERLQGADHRRQLHAVVGGGGLAAVQLALAPAAAQQHAPAARARIAPARAVGVDLDRLLSHCAAG